MKKLFSIFFLSQIVVHSFLAFDVNAQQVDIAPPKPSSKNKFTVNVIAQYQHTSGGDYKIPAPPFSYSPSPVSMKKNTTVHYQFGGTFGYIINKNFEISLGITHSTEGQDYKDYSGTEQDSGTSNTAVLFSYSKRITLSYLNLPLQLHYHTSESKVLSFTCYIGIYYSRLLKYTDAYSIKGSNSYGAISQSDTASGNTFHDIYSVSFPWSTGNRDTKYTFSSKPFKPYDVGEVIGVGLQKKISEDGFLFLMLNYQSGFVDIKNTDSQLSYNNVSYKYYNFFGSLDPNQFIAFKNSLIGISVGLKIII
jgi:hypothetical protein